MRSLIDGDPQQLTTGLLCQPCNTHTIGLSFHNENNIPHVVSTIRKYSSYQGAIMVVLPDKTVLFDTIAA